MSWAGSRVTTLVAGVLAILCREPSVECAHHSVELQSVCACAVAGRGPAQDVVGHRGPCEALAPMQLFARLILV